MYAFWFVFVSMTIVVSTAISTDYVNWDKVNRDFVASNELARAFLASFILVMDLMIVMQVGANYDKNKSRLDPLAFHAHVVSFTILEFD